MSGVAGWAGDCLLVTPHSRTMKEAPTLNSIYHELDRKWPTVQPIPCVAFHASLFHWRCSGAERRYDAGLELNNSCTLLTATRAHTGWKSVDKVTKQVVYESFVSVDKAAPFGFSRFKTLHETCMGVVGGCVRADGVDRIKPPLAVRGQYGTLSSVIARSRSPTLSLVAD